MAVSASPDRRVRRLQEVHDRLYEAACELFLERTFSATSVDEIAERADVARKTAFNHYPRKRDFIAEWGVRRRAQVDQALSADLLAHRDLDVVLRHYFDELAKINCNERALTIRMLHGWRDAGGPFDADPHLLVAVFGQFIADAVASGAIPPTAHPRQMATVLYSAYFGLLYDWCEGTDEDPPFDLREEFVQLLTMVFQGIQHT